MGNFLLGLARWMARRNGRRLARSVSAQLRSFVRRNPTRPAVDHWQHVMEDRRGWHRVRQYLYEFQTGERLELKPKPDKMEILRGLGHAELKPLTAGFHPALQAELLKESVAAALTAWNGDGP